MAKESKTGIIDKIKKLVKKTSVNIFRFGDDSAISADAARTIQKVDYDVVHQKRKDVFSPPYLAIADQLKVVDDQIFRAAVFNLGKIAINEKKAARDIIAILDKYVHVSDKTNEQIDYLKSKISAIKTFHGIEA